MFIDLSKVIQSKSTSMCVNTMWTLLRRPVSHAPNSSIIIMSSSSALFARVEDLIQAERASLLGRRGTDGQARGRARRASSARSHRHGGTPLATSDTHLVRATIGGTVVIARSTRAGGGG